ncbi:MAG: hypothetical protein Fur0032_00660 [Terrimicrobiaceae bacterium]
MTAVPDHGTNDGRFKGAGDASMGILLMGTLVLLAFMLGQVGSWLQSWLEVPVSPVIPLAGFAVAAALIHGLERSLPAIYVGSSLSEAVVGAAAWEATSTAMGLVAAAGAGWAIFRWRRGDPSLSRLRDTFDFLLAGALAAPTAAVAVGMLGALLAGQFTTGWLGLGIMQWQANCIGVLIFGPFSLFVFRRQDLRPPEISGSYELLLYTAVQAWCIEGLLSRPAETGLTAFGLAAGGAVLSIIVALRFGLRPGSLFLSVTVFFVPAFAMMFPGRMHPPPWPIPEGLAPAYAGALHVLFVLGCVLLAALRDELLNTRVRFDLAMQSADLCIWEWSARGWDCRTESWCKKFGLPCGQPLSTEALRHLIHPEDLAAFDRGFRKMLESPETPWTHSYRMKDLNGEWLWVQSSARLLRRSADDGPSVIAGVTRDVTDERNAIQARINAIQNENELRMLRSQLNPHFLFNSLNSVRALIGRDDERARTMVTALSNLLRDVLSSRGDKLHSVSKEIEVVRTYLEIEQIRFGNRLNFQIECVPSALLRQVPGLLIQTLAENAVKHGISRTEAGGSVHIEISELPEANSLRIVVENDGCLTLPTRGASTGFGLASTRQRISLATGGRGTLSIEEVTGPKVRVTVKLPEQTADPNTPALPL